MVFSWAEIVFGCNVARPGFRLCFQAVASLSFVRKDKHNIRFDRFVVHVTAPLGPHHPVRGFGWHSGATERQIA